MEGHAVVPGLPGVASPYYNLGSIYEKDGDLEKATYYFKKRVLVGNWDDEWTVKARKELKGLGVSDPELRENYLDEHLASLESADDTNVRPKGNDLDPKRNLVNMPDQRLPPHRRPP